ncbi:Uncharacterised protein [Nocardia otitidiscaviarum]|uniref:Uncharacterized protein n=1 Tax=Nocardia otitidiscaviarum TaxID=1823 RepID=A0A379JKN5_9NOCA|nr:Uncharacterised protein [Nocardia otitidiscaviarum]
MGSFNVGDWMTALGQGFTWIVSILVSGATAGSS